MHRSFSRPLILGLLSALGLLYLSSTGHAADVERVRFYTWDKAEIHGTFYPGDKGNKSPCVIMLHALGGSSEQDGWADLAKKLQKLHLAVLTFDFRGHGESTAVDPEFWHLNPKNQSLASFRGGRPREQINYKEFKSSNHWAALVDDIAAAKLYLDRKNDSGDCNSSHVVVIGAESGATLGALWIYSEWQRQRMNPIIGLATGPRTRVEGQDIACAVFLSISGGIGVGNSRHSVSVETWLKPIRDKVPMYFLYGEKDAAAAKYSKRVCDAILRGDSKLKLTGMMSIKDTKLAGRELLGKPSLNTEDVILKYVEQVVEARRATDWTKRDADRTILTRVPVERFLYR